MNRLHNLLLKYFAPKLLILHAEKFVVLVLASFYFNTGIAQSSVQVDISRFRNNNGVCQVCLFDNPEAFKGTTGKPVACQKVGIKNRQASLTFSSVQPGTYAVMLFHDANSNGRMDTNFLGIPSEGYGASRNNLPFAAAPTFQGNKFTLHANTLLKLSVRLRNL